MLDNIRSHYRTGQDNLGLDFFKPCLEQCIKYKRASGYFSSSSFVSWASILPRFLIPETVEIQLLISPHISAEDLEALKRAADPDKLSEFQQRIADDFVIKTIELFSESPNEPTKQTCLDLLTWLIAHGKLQLRFAFCNHDLNESLFHEKIGIFEFPDNRKIAFTGSANETFAGHSRNYESIDVFRSWYQGDEERVDVKENQFDEAWGGDANGLKVLSLSEKTLDEVKKYVKSRSKGCSPAPLDKWRHQEEALKAFLKTGNGVLEMATGTGKTRTALKIVNSLIQQDKIDSVIVSTDGVDLLDQWRQEIDEWNLSQNPDLFFRVLRHYDKHHEINDYLMSPGDSVIVVSRLALKDLLNGLPVVDRQRVIIIHDEVHGLGTPSCQRNLTGQHGHFPYRLGLSATPEREYDNVGSQFISSEIGPVVFKFGIEKAIERGILCEFDYLAYEYELTSGDRMRLKDVYKKKAARQKEGNPMSQEEVWTELSKVYKTAEMKPSVFKEVVERDNSILDSTIVFVETKEFGSKVLPLIHQSTHRYRTYYGDDERVHLEEFAEGKIDCLITCHRISQGIDIRNLRNVVLFSSARAKLETIQRIGRCLRFDPNHPDKRAKVIDFVRSPDENNSIDNADQDRYKWLTEIAKTKRIEQ